MTASFVSNQCAAQSLGPANELFGALVQTILTVQCAISAPEHWPKDYGPSAMQNGETLNFDRSLTHTSNESSPSEYGRYGVYFSIHFIEST